MTTIDQQSLCSIELPLPPIQLQHEFSGRVRALEKLKSFNRASLAELDALFPARFVGRSEEFERHRQQLNTRR